MVVNALMRLFQCRPNGSLVLWVVLSSPQCARYLKITQNVAIVWIVAFSTNFCPIRVDLSGNTERPQALAFQKLAQLDHFWHFYLTFVYSKYKRCLLHSQCWMRHFLWFSNTANVPVSWLFPKKYCILVYHPVDGLYFLADLPAWADFH